jgi:hypothetical protein
MQKKGKKTMAKDIKSIIRHIRWQHQIRSRSDEFLVGALSNFKNWREEPDGDYSLSPDELDKRIAFIKSVIASRS